MIRCECEGIHWLEFELLANFPQLQHAVLLRHGGISSGNFASLNLSYHVGDVHDCVQENLNKIKRVLGFPNLIWGHQVHGKQIIRISSESIDDIPTCDGLATNATSQALMIHHADCQAAIFYDPVTHALANVHCGWRGSVQNIYAETIHYMFRTFGSKAENLFVAISPSLGPENAEFVNYEQELPEPFWNYQIKPCYFDFWAISQRQLLDSGVLHHHIQVAKISTYSNPEDYFSYRLAKVKGGNGTIAMLL
jgi:polyphenol oxidase